MDNDPPTSSTATTSSFSSDPHTSNASAPPASYVLSASSTSTQDAPSNSKHSRVTSTVAQSFAADLDSMFGLSTGGGGGAGPGVDVLSQNVAEKKNQVTSGQSELELLEAKLRETEQRLARVSRQNSPSRPANTTTSSSTTAGAPLRGEGEQRQPHPLAQKPTYPADRPPTAPRQDTPGAMSGTPANGEGAREDYVMVDDGRGR